MFEIFKGREQVTEPMPEPVFDREASLIDELHGLDKAREFVGEAMKQFRQRNTATIDGRLTYMCGTIGARVTLDAEWSNLLRQDSLLLKQRNLVLKQLSEIRCPSVYA